MSNTLSLMSANYVARELGYRMTGGWGQGETATQDAFRPLESYAERFDALLREVTALGFGAIDLWLAHLHPAWASSDHIAIARDLLERHRLEVTSLAGGFGGNRTEVEASCRLARALGAPVLGGSTPLLVGDRATLAALLTDHGLVFGYENHPETTPDEVLGKLGEGDEDVIGATVDTGWFGTHGYDAAAAIDALASRLVHVHLKDVREAGAHDTCRFGDGVVPLERCVATLRRIGYRGAFSVEHEPEDVDPTDDIRASRERLEGWLNRHD